MTESCLRKYKVRNKNRFPISMANIIKMNKTNNNSNRNENNINAWNKSRCSKRNGMSAAFLIWANLVVARAQIFRQTDEIVDLTHQLFSRIDFNATIKSSCSVFGRRTFIHWHELLADGQFRFTNHIDQFFRNCVTILLQKAARLVEYRVREMLYYKC